MARRAAMAGEKYQKNSRAPSPAAMVFFTRCFMAIGWPPAALPILQGRFLACWMPLLSMEVSPESKSSLTVTKVKPFCWAVSMSTGR